MRASAEERATLVQAHAHREGLLRAHLAIVEQRGRASDGAAAQADGLLAASAACVARHDHGGARSGLVAAAPAACPGGR